MSTQDETMSIVGNMSLSVILNSRVVDHFLFLKTLHEQGVTSRSDASFAESLRRYLLWFDLLVQEHEEGNSTDTLVPPSDIAWLWHCHRLAPAKYEAFVQSKLLERPTSTLACSEPAGDPYRLMENHHGTLQVWRKHYPTESFELAPATSPKNCIAHAVLATADVEALAGFDLIASAKRQAELYWHLQPHFVATGDSRRCEPRFDVRQALQNYHQFLYLMKVVRGTNTTLVPTYLIDLYWHTHMTGRRMYDYHSDCEQICGRLVNHDDDFGKGKRKDGALGQAFIVTANLWKDTFGDATYAQKGGYRGPPPSSYYTVLIKEEQAPPIADSTGRSAYLRTSSPSDDAATDTTTRKCRWGGWKGVLVLWIILGGVTMRLFGKEVLPKKVEYICGGIAPSRSELEARRLQSFNGTDLPICLQVSLRDEVMCLRSGDPVDQPPVYCQTAVGEFEGEQSDSWYLWFSNCTVCGPAWRMFDSMFVDNESRYKLPTASADVPELPLGTMSWMQWNPDAGDWRSELESLWIEDCDESNGGDDSLEEKFIIPSACYVEKVSISNWKQLSSVAIGLGFLVWIFLLCDDYGCNGTCGC